MMLLNNQTAKKIFAVKTTNLALEKVINGEPKVFEEVTIDFKAEAREIAQYIRNDDKIVYNLIDIGLSDIGLLHHSINVGLLSTALGVKEGYTNSDLKTLAIGALLHDTGKRFAPREILDKPGKLTAEEYELIKTHSAIGYKLLTDVFGFDEIIARISVEHHERVDGSGYPNGLVGDKIHVFSRICAIADAYSALTTDRVYRKAWPKDDAIKHIYKNAGTLFDDRLARSFVEIAR